MFRRRKYQWRYIRLADAVLCWWKSDSDFKNGKEAKGHLDFAINPCEIVVEEAKPGQADESVFILQPVGDSWVQGDFTGAETGRKICFSAMQSEHTVAEWLDSLRAHVAFGAAWRRRATSIAEMKEALNEDRVKEEIDTLKSTRRLTAKLIDRAEAFGRGLTPVVSEADAGAGSDVEICSSGGSSSSSSAPLGFRVLTWNIESPLDASTNPLEFLPGEGRLQPAEEATLHALLARATDFIVRPEKSPRLGDLLGPQPLLVATTLEKAAITEVPDGMVRWLSSREKEWKDLWPDCDANAAAAQWCKDPEARWNYWRRQTFHEWLCDDGSGGHDNPHIKSMQPTIYALCPDLSLCAADHMYRNRPAVGDARKWLSNAGLAPVESQPQPSLGKQDFFKLLVWDMAISALLEHIDDLTPLLHALQPSPAKVRMQHVAAELAWSDVAILLGTPAINPLNLPREFTTELEEFWVVRSVHDDMAFGPLASPVSILARKAVFQKPTAQVFYRAQGVVDPRIVACPLRLQEGTIDVFHVIGCMGLDAGPDASYMTEQVEQAIRDCTLVGCQFSHRTLENGAGWQGAAGLPKLSALLAQSSRVPPNCGSVSGMRSPVQSLVSKMLVPEVKLTECILLSSGIESGPVEGYVSAERRLPDGLTALEHTALHCTAFVEGDTRRSTRRDTTPILV